MEFTRCYSCMQELDRPGGRCPYCGHDNATLARAQKAHTLPCGYLLNKRYVIGKTLGQGGFGVTYIGWDLALELRVCIKEYFPAGAAMRNTTQSALVTWSGGENAEELMRGRDSFIKEARKAVKLRKLSAVVQVWDVFYENDTAYLVMDYIDGVTLKNHLLQTRRPLSEAECVRLMTPVMKDLKEVHARGIIHRDISPDNLMLQSDGTLVLLDIGAAKDLNSGGGQSSVLVAKKGFSPLEQYASGGNIGPWTDVYALCATIVYCVTGKLLPTPMDRLTGTDLSLSAFSPAIAEVLSDGLAIRPEDRIQDMGELAASLNAAIDPQAQQTPVSTLTDTDSLQTSGSDSRWNLISKWTWKSKSGLDTISSSQSSSSLVRKKEEAERKEAERKEAERKEAERKEAERKEAERKEAERKEAERKEAERKEAEEAERKEAERKEAERKEAERKEAERKEAERKEAERKEAERKAAEERKKAAQRKKEEERKAAEERKKAAQRKKAEEREKKQKDQAGANKLPPWLKWGVPAAVLVLVLAVVLLKGGAQKGNSQAKPAAATAPVSSLDTVLQDFDPGDTPTNTQTSAVPQSLHYTVDENHAAITGFDNTASRVDIPSQIEGKPVTHIEASAFANGDKLTAVTIPNSITYIGESAFEKCANLTSVTIPDSVTYIGDKAFLRCSSLESVTLPQGLAGIGDQTFSRCTKLTGVTIPSGVIYIGDSAFEFCRSLQSLSIPNGVTSIGSAAMNFCDSMTSLTIPASVTFIGSTAFSNCEKLTEVRFGGTVEQWDAISATTGIRDIVGVTVRCGA